MQGEVQRAEVKWFNGTKGYGFLRITGVNEDIFAHYSNIQSGGYRTLSQGDIVECEVVEGEKGLQAVSIRLVEAAE